MARPLRVDFPGATHHIFVRGVERSVIARDAADYEHALNLLERAAARFELRCHAWCYLPNHSHLLVTTTLGNLSEAMHWIGTCAAQRFNQRHERVGHLYQGRFGSRLVSDESYLLELARYVALNPVRAGLCGSPEEWEWSSYAATVGSRSRPPFLDTDIFAELLGANIAYPEWVIETDESGLLDERGIPRPPIAIPLDALLSDDSLQAIAIAHFQHGHSKAAIARHLGVSPAQIARRLR
jgi:putative transposase